MPNIAHRAGPWPGPHFCVNIKVKVVRTAWRRIAEHEELTGLRLVARGGVNAANSDDAFTTPLHLQLQSLFLLFSVSFQLVLLLIYSIYSHSRTSFQGRTFMSSCRLIYSIN
jgi:hypothetical protein